MNGYEVARQIRERPEWKSMYLVALTGYGQEEDRRTAIEAGFDYHLTKPTSLDALQQVLASRPARAPRQVERRFAAIAAPPVSQAAAAEPQSRACAKP